MSNNIHSAPSINIEFDAKVIDSYKTVDTSLSEKSENPVQNRAIATAVNSLSSEINSTNERVEDLELASVDVVVNSGVASYPVFNTDFSYTIGDVVIYNGRLYRFIKDHTPGPWVASHIDPTSIKEELELDTNTKVTELESKQKFIKKDSLIIKDNTYYSLISEEYVSSPAYFTSKVAIPLGAQALEMKFELSPNGIIGIAFKNKNKKTISSFCNKTEPSGTSIRVDIPNDAEYIILSYLNEYGISIQESSEFDGITFYIPADYRQPLYDFLALDCSNLPSRKGYVDAQSVWNISGGELFSSIISVDNVSTIEIYANNAKNAIYTFLKEEPIDGKEVNFASGYTENQKIALGSMDAVVVPYDAKYLVVFVSEDTKPQNINLYSGIKEELNTCLSPVLIDVTSRYSLQDNSQKYGEVGSLIQSANTEGLSFVKIKENNLSVRFKTHPYYIVDSYVQYVDDEDVIIKRLYTKTTSNTEYEFVVNFPKGATGVYINTVTQENSLVIKELYGKRSVFDEITVNSKFKKMSVDDAYKQYGLSELDNYFLTGEVGGEIIPTAFHSNNNVRTLKIPVYEGSYIIYPVFLTTMGFSNMLVNADGKILKVYTNETKSDGTLVREIMNGFSGIAYFYLSLYPFTEIKEPIYLYGIESEKKPVKEYLDSLLSEDYAKNNDPSKALSVFGANKMFNELSMARLHAFPFKEYDNMPSCLSTDSNAFLKDGVGTDGHALIKYSDVIAIYDALLEKYPTYITKTLLGVDSSGEIPMYAYTFTPKYYSQSIYLQAGVHGWEPDPVFGLAMIASLIANAYGSSDGKGLIRDDDALRYIRGNVKITIVPCVNPYGFNNRRDCSLDVRKYAQNNANNVQLNAAWDSTEPESVAVRNIIESLQNELSFAIDMHSTVHEDTRTYYGCFYAGINAEGKNLLTIYRTYEWLYRYYDVKYPNIVQGDGCPNPLSTEFASIGVLDGCFNSWIFNNYGIEASTMEFSDHVWTPELHTSIAMSVCVTMYLNQIVQQISDCYRLSGYSSVPKVDMYKAKG